MALGPITLTTGYGPHTNDTYVLDLLNEGDLWGGRDLRHLIPYFETEGFGLLDEVLRCSTLAERRSIAKLLAFKANLESEEESGNVSEWQAAMFVAELSILGFNKSDLDRSVAAVGPIYNGLDRHGFVSPGVFSNQPSSLPGFSEVYGFEFHDGRANVLGRLADDRKSLIFAEDIVCALALAFASSDAPVHPSFSLEDASEGSLPTPLHLKRKLFRPDWLAATDFGRSLYFADYMMKQVWNGGWISFTDASASAAFQPEIHAGILDQVGNLDGEWPTDHGRLMIDLRSITVDHTRESNVQRMRLADADIGVHGAYVKITDGVENRNYRPNDLATNSGRVAAHFTKNYQEIGELLPVFARVKQLLSIARLAIEARKRGILLSESERARLRRFIETKKADVPTCNVVVSSCRSKFPLAGGGVSMAESRVEPYQPADHHAYEAVKDLFELLAKPYEDLPRTPGEAVGKAVEQVFEPLNDYFLDEALRRNESGIPPDARISRSCFPEKSHQMYAETPSGNESAFDAAVADSLERAKALAYGSVALEAAVGAACLLNILKRGRVSST